MLLISSDQTTKSAICKHDKNWGNTETQARSWKSRRTKTKGKKQSSFEKALSDYSKEFKKEENKGFNDKEETGI